MKKSTLLTIVGAVFAIAIYWLGFVNGVYYTENKFEETNKFEAVTDEELVEIKIDNEYGPEYYGVIYGNGDNGFILYEVYSEDGDLKYVCSTSRDYLRNLYYYGGYIKYN